MKLARHPSQSWIATQLDVLGQDYTTWYEGPAEIIAIAIAEAMVMVMVIAIADAEAGADGHGYGSYVAAGCKLE